MKKLFALLLALLLLMSLAGCHPSQSLYAETTVQTTEEATTEMLPDGPVILPTNPKPIDPEQAEQDRLNAEQDLWEAQQGLQGQTQSGQTQTPGTQGQEDSRPRPDQDDQQDPYGQDDREEQPDTPDPTEESTTTAPTQPSSGSYLDPNGTYKTKDEVALYIHLYGRLPSNYITKSRARSQYGDTDNIPKTMNIGGDRFYNKEGLLPSGRTYYECDIGTSGGTGRGTERLVFTYTGWVYYTSNHYKSFTLLYKGT